MTIAAPSVRRLTGAWATLMALTIAMAIAADAHADSKLGSLAVVAVVAAAALKARIILSRYLGLNCAPGALTGFTVAVVAILATVAFSFLASAFLH